MANTPPHRTTYPIAPTIALIAAAACGALYVATLVMHLAGHPVSEAASDLVRGGLILAAVMVVLLGDRESKIYVRGYVDGMCRRPPAGPDEIAAMRAARRRQGRTE